MEHFNALEVRTRCVEWIRKWFAQNGPDCNAVLGISGGKDSTIAAALCVEALGKDRVIGVLMPNGNQKDIDDAFAVCAALGIQYIIAPIGGAYNSIEIAANKIHRRTEDFTFCMGALTPTEQARINLAPRLRMATLYYVSQSLNGRVCNTSNASEIYVGYSTRYGDGAGDFAPLAGLLSDEVMAIGDTYECLPHGLVHKAPADGLTGKTDEDILGFTYAELNHYLRTGECDSGTAAKIDALHQKNLFKQRPMPAFYYWCLPVDMGIHNLLCAAANCTMKNRRCADCPIEVTCKANSNYLIDQLASGLQTMQEALRGSDDKVRHAEYEKRLLIDKVFNITRQRDAAIADLKYAETCTAAMESLLTAYIYPDCSVGLYYSLVNALENITLWQHKDIWWGDRDQLLHDPNNEKGTNTNDQA